MNRRRTTFWVRTLDHARQTRQWVQVQRYYTQTTAAQLTSDLCNAHTRSPDRVRVKGIEPGEVWDAKWGIAPNGPNGDHVVWIRLLNPGHGDVTSLTNRD